MCGTENRPGAALCTSCGARLEGGWRRAEKKGRNRGGRPKQKEQAGSPPRGRDPWPIVAGIAVVGLIGYFIVSEVSRENPGAQQTAGPAPAPAQVPAQRRSLDTSPLEQAVRDRPGDRNALLQLANALHDNGDWVRAIETYRKYLAMDKDNVNARVDMGICYFEMAKTDTVHGTALFDTAIREMESALERNPDHQPAAFNLGVINLTMGNVPESNRWFRRAVELGAGSELGKRAQSILEQHVSITQ
jgi:tetratricopeptide (TPR) repeat protein